MKTTGTNFSWRVIFRNWQQLLVIGMTAALGACGPGLSSLGPFTIGGSVTGLSGTVVLQNNGGDNLSLTADGSFTFATKLAKDATYLVTVLTQPTGQICTVISGGGTATDKVTAVSVDCVTQWAGAKQLGGSGAESKGQSVAVDASGNIYVVGDTTGWLDGNSLVGTRDLFITKYNVSGIKQYTKTLGEIGAATFGRSVAIDTRGNVYVTGYTSGSLGPEPKFGEMDFFVIKYNSNLERQYINQLGVPGKFTYAHSVAVDANFNVYVAGYTTGRFDGTPILGSADLFLAKYDSNGEFKYTTQLGGLALTSTKGYSAATDAFGHVYVAGDTTGELDNNTLSGSTDSFVCQYNTIDGVLQYCNQQGVAGAGTFGRSVAVDSSGNFYMAGDTTGWLDGNPNRGNSDYFVTKYNKDGNWQFTNQFGVAGATTFGNAVAVDATGSVYLAGETSGTLYFDALTGIGSTDFFVAKFNGSGARQYLHQLGAVGQPTSGQSVTVDASNNAYVAGYTFGGLDGNVADLGLSYFFVTKYDKDGVRK